MADGIENGTLINRIHVYTGDPTKGLTDGTLVSQGDFSAPIVGASLNIGTSEIGAPNKCAVRCEPNMITQGPVQLMFVGPNADKWAFGETRMAYLEHGLLGVALLHLPTLLLMLTVSSGLELVQWLTKSL